MYVELAVWHQQMFVFLLSPFLFFVARATAKISRDSLNFQITHGYIELPGALTPALFF